ncbi:butyrophilin subfamily 3 member A3-like [Tupaia chinensis]|uniref:butyrophilin subfamily 3 member A3-like n=1 Tax=Tupaia chinensis TaxID=246437 RepID=UPI000FFB931D|nr:butyrophilin subfamily 3 member A3-like [Tupaia chinensis]
MSVSTDEFVVTGPWDPVVAVLGGDATLSCSLSPPMNAVTMEQRWFRTEFSEVVLSFRDQQEQKEEQMAQYAGRTSLVRDFFAQGEAAVRIHNVQVSDDGLYTCVFRNGGFYEEANLELKVAERSAKLQEQQERKRVQSEKEEAQQAKEEALKASGELRAALRERKAAYLAAWRKAQLYGDWRKEQFQAWAVTLDPCSAHRNLAVSHERTSVTWKDPCEGSGGVPSVLGLEGIKSGRCYWEVEIRNADSTEWALGVCREDAKRRSSCRKTPERGFWVVGRSVYGYYARTRQISRLSLRQPPHRVGVFLDYSEGDVSFYNMTDGSHIFSFPPASFSGTLFPYFRLRLGDVSMTICTTVDGPEALCPLTIL